MVARGVDANQATERKTRFNSAKDLKSVRDTMAYQTRSGASASGCLAENSLSRLRVMSARNGYFLNRSHSFMPRSGALFASAATPCRARVVQPRPRPIRSAQASSTSQARTDFR